MSDKTYMALLNYGAKKGKTVGKLINEILNSFNFEDDTGKASQEAPKLCRCGKPSVTLLKHMNSQWTRLYCESCAKRALESKKWEVPA
jgi:hypothetical protein